jgi:type IV secretory pathway VirB4 component
LGTPGSGKSFAAKREITNVFFKTSDDILICDPEGEYKNVVESLGGTVVEFGPRMGNRINPMDMPDLPLVWEALVGVKSSFILSLIELVMTGYRHFGPVERSVIDRCVTNCYKDYIKKPSPEIMPTLETLYMLLREQPEEEAAKLAVALEMYVKGSLKMFNGLTNTNCGNRLVCYDTRRLEPALKPMAMMVMQDTVWNRVTRNRDARIRTWVYQDEFHLLLKDWQTANYCVEMWKRFRKWGGIPTGMTQNVKDFLGAHNVESILENTDCIFLLNQAPGDRAILQKMLKLSSSQMERITQAPPGDGLLLFGNHRIGVQGGVSPENGLFATMDTRFSDDVFKTGKSLAWRLDI